MNNRVIAKFLSLFCLIFLLSLSAFAIENVSEPKSVLGFTPGDDYKLASWSKVVEYFQKLAKESDRVQFKEVGKTTEGKPFVYSIISSKENLKNLDKYIKINNQLADPRQIKRNDKKANKLIAKGKTFVLITHGIHSTEVGSTLSSMLIAHKLASSDDANILKILDETIVVLVPSLNPDGVDIVKEWYDKTLGTPYEGTAPPELYQKYVGHDNNRDWYAFTQIETQHTVTKIHNVFHPQIVHDVHQQGRNSARFFVPPYLTPIEPNVPQEIIEGYTEIGNYVANQMREDGLKGITTGSTYDAWTPARAYSHYHGGVRILSETASANLASPILVEYDKLTSRRGFNIKEVSANYGPLWMGGKWGMGDITNYMTTGALHLLDHAAENREAWLKRFYKIGKEATRPRKDGEIYGYRVKIEDNFPRLKVVLQRAGVQYGFPKDEKSTEVNLVSYFDSTESYPSESIIIPLEQPYGAFAKAILENQVYPDLKDEKGNPIPPYDVTAHTLSLLMNVEVEVIKAPFKPDWVMNARTNRGISDCRLGVDPKIGVYKSYVPSMDEGWTRWILDKGPCFENENINNEEINKDYFDQKTPQFSSLPNGSKLASKKDKKYRTIIFPDQSPKTILEGYEQGKMPKEYTGGIKGEGVKNLKNFVEAGGTAIFLNRSSDFAIEQFNLSVINIAKDWKQKDFFIPGSILRTELDTSHPITAGMDSQSIAWFERSPVFEVTDKSRVKVIAKYPTNPNEILLSGWALGKDNIAGKAALVEVTLGKGKIILFGFRPQYRGQSLATFPLLFNAVKR